MNEEDTPAIMMKELYSIAIASGVDAEYFLDRMQQYELEALIYGLEERNKPSWEQARLIAYIIAQSNSTKSLKVTDIIKFRWDEAKYETEEIDWDEIREAKEKLKTLKGKPRIKHNQVELIDR